jgi:hypothetical protein
MFTNDRPEEIQSWWKKLWKIRSPLQAKVFIWLVIMNNSLLRKYYRRGIYKVLVDVPYVRRRKLQVIF